MTQRAAPRPARSLPPQPPFQWGDLLSALALPLGPWDTETSEGDSQRLARRPPAALRRKPGPSEPRVGGVPADRQPRPAHPAAADAVSASPAVAGASRPSQALAAPHRFLLPVALFQRQRPPSSATAHKLMPWPRRSANRGCHLGIRLKFRSVGLFKFSVYFRGRLSFSLIRKAFYKITLFFTNPHFNQLLGV